ncbi:M23 family metallopeptidase, partial [Anaerotruncus rubiinfantis]
AAPRGTPVYAAAEGKVSLAGWYGEYGRCVIIDHADGSQTLYGHNSALMVSAGQTVKQGQKIAEVGSTGNSTGNHLHLELRVGSRFLDPLIYLDQ